MEYNDCIFFTNKYRGLKKSGFIDFFKRGIALWSHCLSTSYFHLFGEMRNSVCNVAEIFIGI